MFLGKGVPKICSKFTGEHPCRSVISILQLYWNHTSTWVLSCKAAAYFRDTFSRSITGLLLLNMWHRWNVYLFAFVLSSELRAIFLWCSEKSYRKLGIFTRVNQKKTKPLWKECVTWTCFKFWSMKNIFRKLQRNKSLIMASLQNCRELSFATFHRFHWNSEELSYFPW